MIMDLSGKNYARHTQFSLQGFKRLLITDQASGEVEQGQRASRGVGKGENLFQTFQVVLFEGGPVRGFTTKD